MQTNLKWNYQLNKKGFTTTAACILHCPEHILTAKLDTSPYWFIPWDSYMITLSTFQRNIRKLAKEHQATEVTITTLDKIQTDNVIRYKKIGTEFVNRKAVEKEWIFAKTNKNSLQSKIVRESELFFYLQNKERTRHEQEQCTTEHLI